jgi:hypothetical protein
LLYFAVLLSKGFEECFGNLGNLGIYPSFEATEGTEAILLDRPQAFPLTNNKPASEHLTRRLSRDALHLLTTRMTNNNTLFHLSLLLTFHNSAAH